MTVSTRLKLVVVALIGIMGSACAPRIVTAITVSDDNVKMVYNRTTLMSFSTGIVQCDANKDGDLSNCEDLEICFWHERKEKCQSNK